MTVLQEFTKYARQASEQMVFVPSTHFDWAVILRSTELTTKLIRHFGDKHDFTEVLFESQSLPGYLATLERTKERLTTCAKGSSGKTGTWTTCLNPWDPQGKRVQSADGKSPCLSASADAGGNTISLVMDKSTCYDMNHPCDVIRTYDNGKTPTLEARMGTGGNNIPLVTDDTVFLERQFFGSHVGKASTLTRFHFKSFPANH